MKSWFSIASIREEVRKVVWLSPKQLSKDTFVVIGFVLFFVVYFLLTDFVLAAALRLIGIGA